MSEAELRFGDLREVRLRAEAMRKMCVSVGTMRRDGERIVQPPGSTSRLRTERSITLCTPKTCAPH